MARPGRRSKSPGPVRLRRSASYPYHDVIDQLGAEVVAAARDERPPRRDHACLERRRWTAIRTLDHRLGVNNFFTDLQLRPHPSRLATVAMARRSPPANEQDLHVPGRPCPGPRLPAARPAGRIRPMGRERPPSALLS